MKEIEFVFVFTFPFFLETWTSLLDPKILSSGYLEDKSYVSSNKLTNNQTCFRFCFWILNLVGLQYSAWERRHFFNVPGTLKLQYIITIVDILHKNMSGSKGERNHSFHYITDINTTGPYKRPKNGVVQVCCNHNNKQKSSLRLR